MTDMPSAEQAYAQAQAYGRDVARLYAAEKKRRKELETISQKFQAIFNTAPNGLVVVDNVLNIVDANPQFLAMFQYPTDAIGKPLATLLPMDEIIEAMAVVKSGLSSVEINIVKPVARTLQINLASLQEEEGWVLIVHDLTERKRVEGLKDEFLNIAAHELRTPLAGIMGFVSVLQEELKTFDDPVMLNLSQWIIQSTERLKLTIDELVKLVAVNRSDDIHLHAVQIDLGQMLEKLLGMLNTEIEAISLHCELKLPADPIVVHGDRFILGEALFQILKNAVMFNREHGQVLVTPKILTDEVVLIEIADTGAGIPQTEINNIFDRFYQVEEHLTRGVSGLGLGLSIAKEGISRHGGRIIVDSQLGQGSTFKVFLPPLTEQTEVSIDSRLDVAHRQLLAYAKDMAHAVTAERKLTSRLDKIQTISVDLSEKLAALDASNSPELLDEVKHLAAHLVQLSK